MGFEELMERHLIANELRKSVEVEAENPIFTNFENNIAYRKVRVNNREIGIHFITRQRDFGIREIYAITKPEDTIEVGDYITDHNGEIWLCYSYDNYPIRKNYLTACNRTLRLYRDGEIHDLPCALSDKTSVYSDGLNKGRRLTLSDDQILVTLPDNDLVKTIKYNERFIFGGDSRAVYRVRRVDILEKVGVVELRMRHDRYDEVRDNLELSIADYFEVKESEVEFSNDLIIEGPDSIMNDTTEYYYIDLEGKDVVFKIIEGRELAEVDYTDGNECGIKAGSKNGNIKLEACVDGTCVTKDIKISDWWW